MNVDYLRLAEAQEGASMNAEIWRTFPGTEPVLVEEADMSESARIRVHVLINEDLARGVAPSTIRYEIRWTASADGH